MEYVYVLRSEKDQDFYVGHTKNLRDRIIQHNSGLVRSTKSRKSLKLVYYEFCLNQKDAVKRKKYLKTSWGKRYIKGRLRDYLEGLAP